MKSYSANRDRLYVYLIWKSIRGLITFSSFATVLLMTIFSIFILIYAENLASNPQSLNEKILWLSKAAWLGICGSIFASAVFWGVQAVMALFNRAKRDTYEQTYRTLVEEFGLNTIYKLKGGNDALHEYKRVVENAKRRIWAVGMSNRNFSRQHMGKILDLLKRNPSVDVVIAFWNPNAYLVIEEDGQGEVEQLGGTGEDAGEASGFVSAEGSTSGATPKSVVTKPPVKMPVFVAQAKLEEREPNSAKEIRDRQHELEEMIEKERSAIQGHLRILNLSMVTYISCMVIDQEVFFFPYLSGDDSNGSPMIYCDATRGIGEQVFGHIDNLINNKRFRLFCEEVYSIKGPGTL